MQQINAANKALSGKQHQQISNMCYRHITIIIEMNLPQINTMFHT